MSLQRDRIITCPRSQSDSPCQISLPPASGKGRHPLLRASFISALIPHPPLFSLQISVEFQRGGINKKSQMLFLVRRGFFMPSLLSFGQLR